MTGFNKQGFIAIWLCVLVDHFTISVSLSNQPLIARPMLTDLNPDELHYYPPTVTLKRCNGSCNTVEDPSVGICVPIKQKIQI